MYPVVNLGLLFTELPWRRRFAAAAETGFDRVEFPWPPLPPDEVTWLVRAAGVQVALLNMDAGDLAAGQRGYSNDPRLTARWRDDLRRAVDLARDIGCPLVNVLAGRRLPELDERDQLSCLTDNLRWAADLAEAAGLKLVVEPINDHDIPGYLLPRVSDVIALLDQVGRPVVELQLDAYHVAAMGDDVTKTVAAAAGVLGHVQIADFPGRHEPGTGALDVDALLAALGAAGYDGGLALEYVPTLPSSASLRAVAARYPRLGPIR
ncbi:hydroxypyruvate isomerase family protein [Micromonospora sp. ATA51]|uniref:hydroxypyruvate isomerase family protein n=1 Tax=Micromonospora sp. ATA51 TaxID=2806098 RepID=UPI001A38A930|nr:TIM barrel protein [Micromonospora sp. ATA51]MBM0224725.1 TIM barrel protein [Micromonospora sp. ATA51]